MHGGADDDAKDRDHKRRTHDGGRSYIVPAIPSVISVDYRLNRHAEGVSIDLQASTNLLDENSWVPAASVDPISLGLDPLTADPRYRLEVGIETQNTEYLRLNITLPE